MNYLIIITAVILLIIQYAVLPKILELAQKETQARGKEVNKLSVIVLLIPFWLYIFFIIAMIIVIAKRVINIFISAFQSVGKTVKGKEGL
jgi:hypothetical protein